MQNACRANISSNNFSVDISLTFMLSQHLTLSSPLSLYCPQPPMPCRLLLIGEIRAIVFCPLLIFSSPSPPFLHSLLFIHPSKHNQRFLSSTSFHSCSLPLSISLSLSFKGTFSFAPLSLSLFLSLSLTLALLNLCR